MTGLLIDDRGLATLEIADAAGELHSYRMVPAAAGVSAWAVGLERLDTGATYRVCERSPGRWLCDCEDFRYRKSRLQGRGCKHVESVMGLRARQQDEDDQPPF